MPGLEDLFQDPAAAEAMSDAAFVAAMLRFETALAGACADAGMATANEAAAIGRAAGALDVDWSSLAARGRHAGTLAIPLVRDLTERVASTEPAASRWVHHGATSQDVIDTATVLCLREGAKRVVAALDRLGTALAGLAGRHAETPMLARTLLQPAPPVPFGWKVAGWLAPLTRSRRKFDAALAEASTLQYGGATGVLGSAGASGLHVAEALAARLQLTPSSISWHGARDAFARLAAEAAILAGLAAKIATDLSCLMQTEIAETSEPANAGRGGSSAMPHKRNPTGCVAALEFAHRAPALAATLLGQLSPAHERGLGEWQSQFFTLRGLIAGTAGALDSMAVVAEGLVVAGDAMRSNIGRTRGLVYSELLASRLAPALGREAAQTLVAKLCERVAAGEGTLAEIALGDPRSAAIVGRAELEQLFRPESCFGQAQAMIDATVADWKSTGNRTD